MSAEEEKRDQPVAENGQSGDVSMQDASEQEATALDPEKIVIVCQKMIPFGLFWKDTIHKTCANCSAVKTVLKALVFDCPC